MGKSKMILHENGMCHYMLLYYIHTYGRRKELKILTTFLTI